eukprot:NODE_7171_length_457_cov_136.194030.p2 GENE.NODE_7171_length_457_cov_136.194030~~NODE_7171_length_457_cov_136.194030.p2  ORF type:complete len:116 (+),score=35.40 NODE_7171_length_457_cov_136.194030:3-350(+)
MGWNADGTAITGKLGRTTTVEEAYKAARGCGISLLKQMKPACDGDLTRVQRIVKLEGFVNCTEDFTQHPAVINGCSDFMAEIFGAAVGTHSRTAVGVTSLPLGAVVEVSAIFEIA